MKHTSQISKYLLAAGIVFSYGTSIASEQIVGHVTYVEPTYLPGMVQFSLDSGSLSCPAGSYLKWQNADQSNNLAVYASLLSAMSRGKSVRIFINDGDTSCVGTYIHFLSGF